MQNICIFENTYLYLYSCCYQIFWLHMVSSSITVAMSVFLPSTGVPIAQGEVCRTRSTFRWHIYGQLPSFVLPFICLTKPSPYSLTLGKPLLMQMLVGNLWSFLVSLFLHLLKIEEDWEECSTTTAFTCLAHSLVLLLGVHCSFLCPVVHSEN